MINPKNQPRRLPERKPPWPIKLPTASGALRRKPSPTLPRNPLPGACTKLLTPPGAQARPLGASLFRHQVVTTAQAPLLLSLQGVKMGRPSSSTISLTISQNAIQRVRVGGAAVLVGEGPRIC
jgi:hypothetical protein